MDESKKKKKKEKKKRKKEKKKSVLSILKLKIRELRFLYIEKNRITCKAKE